MVIVILLGSASSRWLMQAPSPEPSKTSTVSGQVMPLANSPAPLPSSETTSLTPDPSKLIVSSPIVMISEATDSKGVQMVLVPEGEFAMGSDNGNVDEKPVHQVFLDAYYIDKYEVTNALYKQCVDVGSCDMPKIIEKFSDVRYKDHPVGNVRWEMAKEYCEWRDARLPTEAEWEKAARGTDERTYPWGNVFDGNIVNFCDSTCIEDWADKNSSDGYQASSPVGSYPDGVSPFGAYDMAGNVYEWVADWYDENYYGNSPARNPLGPENGEHRVMRGGSYYDHYYNERSARRLDEIPLDFYNNIGFRCARSFTPTLNETKLPKPEETVLPANVIDPKGVEMVLVPGGEFTMGSDDGEPHERPTHQVFINAYYIDKYEVTNALYKLCVAADVCDYPTRTSIYGNSRYAEHPVVYVDWNMAKKYCEWRDARLPTEAEWEKAARGTDERIYPWGDGIDCTYANYDYCVEDTTVVGSYQSGKSPYGSYDMAGNVWEWVEDFYSFDYFSAYPSNQWPSNPTGPASGEFRILRGGSWINPGEFLRSSYRDKSEPTGSSYNWGFRCARSD